jgi:hypothetical protein
VLIQICISHKTVCVCLYVQKEDKEKAWEGDGEVFQKVL